MSVTIVLPQKLKDLLHNFLRNTRKAELLPTYIYYVEQRYNISPVVFPVQKRIYRSEKTAIELLEKSESIWRETEIKIRFGQASVNEDTTKIYICPWTGKVYGNNTHPNPQDAIYDWVARCPENTERTDGLRVKRFFVSEDPDVIKNYIKSGKAPVTKVVFSSAVNNKLYNTKQAVIKDFKKNYLRPLTLMEVQSQNRFDIEDDFLAFLQDQLQEEKVTAFVEALAEHQEFAPYIERWLAASGEEEEETETTIEIE
jgi:hypothetical protein